MSNDYILKLPKMSWMKYIIDFRNYEKNINKYKYAMTNTKF